MAAAVGYEAACIWNALGDCAIELKWMLRWLQRQQVTTQSDTWCPFDHGSTRTMAVERDFRHLDVRLRAWDELGDFKIELWQRCVRRWGFTASSQ